MINDPTYLHIIPWTLLIVLVMVVLCGVLGYAVALFLSRSISSERLRTVILLLLVIPFWTNYLIRMTTWLPLLGRNGLVNTVLVGLGVLKSAIGCSALQCAFNAVGNGFALFAVCCWPVGIYDPEN